MEPAAPMHEDPSVRATYVHFDDVPWQHVRTQMHPDGQRSVWEKWFVIGREPIEAYLKRVQVPNTPAHVVAEVKRLHRVHQLTDDDEARAAATLPDDEAPEPLSSEPPDRERRVAMAAGTAVHAALEHADFAHEASALAASGEREISHALAALEPADERADQFSLAAVTYEMLAGCPPFADESSDVDDDEDRTNPGGGSYRAPPRLRIPASSSPGAARTACTCRRPKLVPQTSTRSGAVTGRPPRRPPGPPARPAPCPVPRCGRADESRPAAAAEPRCR